MRSIINPIARVRVGAAADTQPGLRAAVLLSAFDRPGRPGRHTNTLLVRGARARTRTQPAIIIGSMLVHARVGPPTASPLRSGVRSFIFTRSAANHRYRCPGIN